MNERYFNCTFYYGGPIMGDIQRIELKQTKVGKEDIYIVKKIQNSTSFDIDEEVTKERVNDLCNMSSWEVTIK